MEMTYQVRYLDEVVHNDIPDLSLSARTLIKRAIEERLTTDSIGFGKPLRYSLKGHRRIRVSDYRIIYRIEAEVKKVIIVAIKYRKDAY
jgi:addiction module RelE/StbE family toxin